jgi:hypothetical protein
MAQKVQTLFIDDLDGTEADGTVRFGLDGTEYEIDLNAEHTQQLREALARCSPLEARIWLSAPPSAARTRRSQGGLSPDVLSTTAP